MSWEKLRLDDICNVITCGVAKRPEYQDSGIPFLSSLNVKENRFILKSYKYISEKDHEQLTKYSKPEKGDILYTRVGSFGEAAVVDLDFDFSIFVSLTLIKPKHELIDSRFLMWHLNSPDVRSFANNNTSGIGVQNLNVGVVREFQIPLPPLSTQKRIAEILDAADALKRKDQALLKKYDELAQAIFIDMFGDPVKNEKGWEVKTIRSIALKISDGPFGSNLKTEHYSKEGVRVIRLKNIGVNTFNDEDSAFVNIQHYENVIKKYTCVTGDILIGTLGEPNLRACIFPPHLDKAVNKADCIMLRINPKICNQNYVSYFLNIPSFVESVANKLHGQTRTRISMGQVASLSILIPPKSLQDKFFDLITNLKFQNDFTIGQNKNSNSLFQTLIQKAFKGEL